MHWPTQILHLCAVLSLCGACDVRAESSAAREGLQPFVPGECGSWNPPVAEQLGQLPPEASCVGEGCVVFTEVGAEAGLGTQQFVETHPSALDCIFPRATLSGSPVEREGCSPQWTSGGASVGDVNDDGWPDIYMTRLAGPDHLFVNRGDGTFVDRAAELGLGECTWTNGSVFGDVDNDGDLDLLVTALGEHAHRLYINQLSETGEPRFEEEGVARAFALTSERMHLGQSVTLGDLDRDGWLDAHVNEWIGVENHPAPGDPLAAMHGSRLLRNTGKGHFEDITDAYGVNLAGVDEDGIFAFASTFVDLDGDGWQDLTVTVDFGHSRLFWSEAGQRFDDGTASAGVNLEENAMGSAFADLDADGALDWFVTAIAEPGVCSWEAEDGQPCWAEEGSGNRLYRYGGERSFTDATQTAGVVDGAWAWGAVAFDADNDADQDLALVNGWLGRDSSGGTSHFDSAARLWLNAGDGVMREQGEALGFDDRGQGRGVVSFDYDRDGDLDLLVVNHAGAPRLFRNDGGNRRAWLRVALEGTRSNRDGRGAKVRVQVEPGGPWQVREVGVGSHFLGEGELIQHFGLGLDFDAERGVHRVEVEWPASGTVQVFEDVEGMQQLEVVEVG